MLSGWYAFGRTVHCAIPPADWWKLFRRLPQKHPRSQDYHWFDLIGCHVRRALTRLVRLCSSQSHEHGVNAVCSGVSCVGWIRDSGNWGLHSSTQMYFSCICYLQSGVAVALLTLGGGIDALAFVGAILCAFY